MTIFENYWDMALTGFIGGLVVYLLSEKEIYFFDKKLFFKNKILKAFFVFLILLLIILLYSFSVWLFRK